MSQNLVVVQAASGLLGCHVVKDLLENGYSVRAIVSADSGNDKLSMLINLRSQFEKLEISPLNDINDLNEYESLYKDARYAVFSASPYRVDLPNPEKYQKDVLSILRNAFRAIERNSSTIKKVAYVASVAALVDLDNLVLRKEMQQRPATVSDRNTNTSLQTEYPYDYLQCQALKEIERLRGEISVPVVFLYVGFPVGPVLDTSRRSGNVMDWAALYTRQAYDRKRQRVYCYSNVQDVAFAIRKVFASDQIKSGNDYIVAESQPTHPMKVYDTFRNYKSDLIKFYPSNEDRQRMLEEAQRFKSMTALDISKTQADLGIEPQDSEKSLSLMIKSLVDQKLLSELSA